MPTFAAFQRLTAAQIENLLAPGWTAYTCSWTASTINPSLGNGVLSARYRRSTGADLVVVQIHLTMGSTTTYGTGFWRFSLPFTADTSAAGFAGAAGAATLIDSSAAEGGYRNASCWLQSSTMLALVTNSGGVSSTVPFTWTTADQIRLAFTYQPA